MGGIVKQFTNNNIFRHPPLLTFLSTDKRSLIPIPTKKQGSWNPATRVHFLSPCQLFPPAAPAANDPDIATISTATRLALLKIVLQKYHRWLSDPPTERSPTSFLLP